MNIIVIIFNFRGFLVIYRLLLFLLRVYVFRPRIAATDASKGRGNGGADGYGGAVEQGCDQQYRHIERHG